MAATTDFIAAQKVNRRNTLVLLVVLTALAALVGYVIGWLLESEASDAVPLWSKAGVAAAGLMLVGLAWGRWVDPTLRYWLWPTALIALPLALIPAVLIFIALVLVMVIDFGAAVAVALRQKQAGEPLNVEMPTLGATQARV